MLKRIFTSPDRIDDLTLRLLTLLVLVVLGTCVGMLTWRWMQPAPADVALVKLTPLPPAPASAPARLPSSANEPVQVLLVPGKINRCLVDGQWTFTDQPCRDGKQVDVSSRTR